MDDCETNISHKPGPSFLMQMEPEYKDEMALYTDHSCLQQSWSCICLLASYRFDSVYSATDNTI